MYDPYTMVRRFGPITLWHRDRAGVDGACGWFMRAHHGNPTILKAIENSFAQDWSRQCHTHNLGVTQVGLFDQKDFAAMSVHGIALNLFWLAAYHHFLHNREKVVKFMRRNLAEILLFAENPVDSAHTSWVHTFGYDDRKTREDRIHTAASMVYGWILRATRPWYKHPRWHIHHWRITVNWPSWPREGRSEVATNG